MRSFRYSPHHYATPPAPDHPSLQPIQKGELARPRPAAGGWGVPKKVLAARNSAGTKFGSRHAGTARYVETWKGIDQSLCMLYPSVV